MNDKMVVVGKSDCHHFFRWAWFKNLKYVKVVDGLSGPTKKIDSDLIKNILEI